MELNSDGPPDAGDGVAEETKGVQLDRMGSATSLSADQGTSDSMPQRSGGTFEDRVHELEQRLAALSGDTSPPRSSNDSFKSAPEQMSPEPLSQNAVGEQREENSPEMPSPVHDPPQGRSHQGSTTMERSSRTTTSHQTSTGPSTMPGSTAPTSLVPSVSSSNHEGRAPTSTHPSASSSNRGAAGPATSASSSRRSSPHANQPASAQPSRPVRRHRRNLITWPPPTAIADRRQAMQSVRAFSDYRADVLAGMRAEARLQSSSVPTLQRPTTTPSHSVPTNANNNANAAGASSPDLAPHIPAANIDWTLPSTRRREYASIDRARSGFRGLVRRVVPRFLHRDARIGFHGDGEDGNGSDAGTVRRFRMDVAGGDGDGEGGKRQWWRFGRKKVGRGEGGL